MNTAKGFILALALVFLLIIALVASAALRTAVFEQQITAAQSERAAAFEAAEAALRYAEAQLQANPQAVSGSCICLANGICSAPSTDCAERWRNPNLPWQSAPLFTGLSELSARYLAEDLGAGCIGADGVARCRRYRIFAVASFGAGRARVLLESYVQVAF